MAFAALWLNTLAISLLWTILFHSRSDDVRPAWFWRFLLAALRAVPLLVLSLLTIFAAAMQFGIAAGPRWFGFALSLIITYIVGRIALRQTYGVQAYRRLTALALLVAVSVDALILQQIDAAIQLRCRLLSAEALTQFVADLPPAPTGQNAATIYATLLPELAKDQPDDLHNPPLGDGETFDPHEPGTHAYLQRNAGTLDVLRRATTLPCRFDEDLSQPDLSHLNSLNPIRTAANALSLHSRQALADGDVDAAIDDSAAVLRFSEQYSHRPLLIHALVAIGVRALGYDMVERALPAITSHQQLATLPFDQLTSADAMLRQALRGEKRYGLSVYGGYDAVDLLGSSTPPVLRSLRTIGTAQSLFTRVFIFHPDAYVRLIDHVGELSREPNYKVRNEIHSFYAGHATDDLMANILASSLAHALEVCDVLNAHDACLRCAIAMIAYRLDHGVLPKTLAELTPNYLPSVPIDPFSGLPIKLVHRDNEWRVYSIGDDAVDNGGVDESPKERDIVVRVKENAATSQP